MLKLHTYEQALKKFNVYTKPVDLLLLKETGHRTFLGVFLTIGLIVLVVFVYYSGLYSLVVRNNPNAFSYTTYTTDYDEFFLTPTNFTIAIAQQGYDLKDSFIIEAYTGYYQDSSTSKQEIPMTKCTQFQFSDSDLNTFFSSTDYIWYCIDWSVLSSITLNRGSINSFDKSLQITIKSCTSMSQCNYPNLADSSQFIVKLTSAYIDVSNFESPCNLIGKKFYLNSLTSFSKNLNIYLQPHEIQTDNGYVIQDQTSETTLVISDTLEIIEEKGSGQIVFSVNVSLDPTSTIYQRQYPRVQQFLGDVGGFWEIIYISAALFILPFNKLSYRVTLLNELFNFDQNYDSKIHPDKRHSSRVRDILQKSVQLEKFNRMSKVQEGEEHRKTMLLDQISSEITEFFKEQESKLDLSLFDYFGCCQCKKGGKRDLINFSMGKITHTLDITYIIKKLQEIDKLKLILLNSDQLKLFDYLPKPKIGLHTEQNENQYCSILKPELSDLEKALEAQKAYQALQDQNDDITPKLVKLLDDDLISLFKLQLNKGVNRFVKKPQHLAEVVSQLMVMNQSVKEQNGKKKKKKNDNSQSSSESNSSDSDQ